MGFDSALMRASVLEIDQALRGARVNRIHQPDRLTLALRCHGHQGAVRVILSARTRDARVQLTEDTPDNPAEPPMFCMLLRKRLENGRVVRVFQDGLERTAVFHIESVDELGDLHDYLLTVETMGKHSNILLVDPGDAPLPIVTDGPYTRQTPVGTVVDAIKRVTPDMSRVRPILPGVRYVAPPAFERPSLKDLDARQLEIGLGERADQPAWRALLQSYLGLSPAVATEFLLRCEMDPSAPVPADGAEIACLYRQLVEFRDLLEQGHLPLQAVYSTEGKPLEFAACDLAATARRLDAQVRQYSSPGKLLDAVFVERRRLRQLDSLRHAVVDPVRSAIQSLRTREQHQLDALDRAAHREQHRIFGELITANMHQLEKGTKEVEVTNWYDPDQRTVTIPLNPSLSPSENAQRYFRKYNKLKRTHQRAGQELRRIRTQLNYLETVEYAAESAEDAETLEELREELRKEGILKAKPGPRKGHEHRSEPYHSFRSSDGYTVYVGKNNRGNDLLTLRMAHPDDQWFHVKDLAGAHVIVRTGGHAGNAELPETTLLEAAQLAAYYSKGRQSTNVPVDHTEARHVRKPRGAKPGMVIYDHHQTLWVTPAAELVRHLRQGD